MINEKMQSINLSYKYPTCVFIRDNNGKDFKRNYYERKNTKGSGNPFYTYYEGVAYSFNIEMEKVIQITIKSEGPYKDFQKSLEKGKLIDDLKVEMEQKQIEPQIIVVEDNDGKVRHEKFGQIKVCVESNIPVYLVGPAGSGKNHTLEQIAEELGLDFYFTNSIQQEYKITGFIDAGGNYHETEFYKAFSNGGLFFLDEMDASIPEVLVLLNAAIANKYFEFPNGKIHAHEDFRVVAAGNTVGNGADEQYAGRLVLDQATLDRFAIIEFDYSEKIELHLAKGNRDLVDFIRDLRKQSTEKGIRSTFSYRCISMVQKLEGKLILEDILIMAIFKGMDKDTINTFRVNGYSRYSSAMKKVQGA